MLYPKKTEEAAVSKPMTTSEVQLVESAAIAAKPPAPPDASPPIEVTRAEVGLEELLQKKFEADPRWLDAAQRVADNETQGTNLYMSLDQMKQKRDYKSQVERERVEKEIQRVDAEWKQLHAEKQRIERELADADSDPDLRDVHRIYEQAGTCASCGAYTATVELCRRLMMHVAVKKGARAGLNFVQSVSYLDQNGLVPTDAIGWLDRIRDIGNYADHELPQLTRDQAAEALDFAGMLLNLIYGYPVRVRKPEREPSPRKASGKPRK